MNPVNFVPPLFRIGNHAVTIKKNGFNGGFGSAFRDKNQPRCLEKMARELLKHRAVNYASNSITIQIPLSMSRPIPFTDNYTDLSTDRGFQFRFCCERCGNGYQSSFVPNVTGMAGDALRAASGLFGGFLGRAADSATQLQRMIGGPAHDNAMRAAVEEVSPEFTQCQRCGQWVCRPICWNGQRNQCVSCSPKMEHEIAAIESQGTISQLQRQAYDGDTDLTGGVRLNSAASGVQSVAALIDCPDCSAKVSAGAKFCGDCGRKMQIKLFCPSCGVEAAPSAKFCGDCGTKLGA